MNTTSARRVPLLEISVPKLGKESLELCRIISNLGVEECRKLDAILK